MSVYSDHVLAPVPAIYYRAGESSGTVANDASGNARHGTIGANITKGVAGALAGDSDTALTLPATVTTAADFLAAPDGYDPVASGVAGEITVDGWWKHPAGTYGGTQWMWSLGNSTDVSTWLALTLNRAGTAGALQWELRGQFSYNLVVSDNVDMRDGLWHHYRATMKKSGMNVTMKLWVDGVLRLATETSGFSASLAFDRHSVGVLNRSSITPGGAFTVDEVAVYPTALGSSADRYYVGTNGVKRYGRKGNATRVTPTFDSVVNANSKIVGAWKLDETSGTAIAGAKGSAGTWTDPPTLGAITGPNRVRSQAPQLDGTNDYGTIPTYTALPEVGPLAVGGFVYPTASTNNRFAARRSAGGPGWGAGLGGTSPKFTTFGIKDYIFTTVVIPLNRWSHIGFNLRSDHTVECYVNGRLEGEITHTAGANAADVDLLIGRHPQNTTEHFPSGVWGVVAGDNVLASEEWRALANLGFLKGMQEGSRPGSVRPGAFRTGAIATVAPPAGGPLSLSLPVFLVTETSPVPSTTFKDNTALTIPAFDAGTLATPVPGFTREDDLSLTLPAFAVTGATPVPSVARVDNTALTIPAFAVTETSPVPAVAAERSLSLPLPAFAVTGDSPAASLGTRDNLSLNIPAADAGSFANPLPSVAREDELSLSLPAFDATEANPVPGKVFERDVVLTVPPFSAAMTNDPPVIAVQKRYTHYGSPSVGLGTDMVLDAIITNAITGGAIPDASTSGVPVDYAGSGAVADRAAAGTIPNAVTAGIEPVNTTSGVEV